VLATLDPDADFILHTDTLDTAIGGVLAQKQMFEGRIVEWPLGYFLRKLHAVEVRYPAYDQELLAISANLEHWACYVDGRKRTTIYTDHSSLQHILGQNKLTSCQWHHLDRLQRHDYNVKYFPAAANVVADALSRIANTQGDQPKVDPQYLNVIEMRVPASTKWLNDVRKGYREDTIFGPVLEYLSNSDESKQTCCVKERAKSYTLKEGLLYHKPLGGRLCIPKFLRTDVIPEAHGTILGSGCGGIAKTPAAVGSRYYWLKLTDSVAEWIAGCDIRHRIKHKNASVYGLLQALLIPLERAERVNIDFVTKLQTSEAGYEAIATIIDPLTKRARWIPGRKAELTAEKFATAFIDGYVRSQGLPVSIRSDQDTSFTSSFWQSLCSQFGIMLRMSRA